MQPAISNPQPPIHFSQGSLQDYVDCRRRFQLRYLLHLAWPALEAEPVQEHERDLRQGALFHRLIQQHLLGVPADRLSIMAKDEELERWWQNYLEFSREGLAGLGDRKVLAPEIVLSAPLAGQRLVAKYDLIIILPGPRAVILDWKTSRKKPRRQWLAERLQTRVYPYLLVQAGAHLNQGQPFQPDQVEMIYWLANFPTEAERFPYSPSQFKKDGEYLASLIAEIQSLETDDFHLTPHEERCRFCTYRSLCQRGVKAGDLGEKETDLETTEELEAALDFEQIAEIEF